MDQETEKFITEVEPLVDRNSINKNNLFVFDETYIGDPVGKQHRVGERRKSGGGNINVFQKRGKALGAFIPFSKSDGTTPFRVFILRDKNSPEASDSVPQSRFVVKFEESPTIRRLYLTSKSGCLTKSLFKIVLEYFSKWWNQENPGLQCFFICDQLPVHMNESIKEYAKARGISIIPIMPGSSHWFQVQDQLPFGTLKKKMSHEKNRFSLLSSLGPEDQRSFLMGILSTIESEALTSGIVLKSFADVGLSPWNPDRVRELCQVHCPPPYQLKTTTRLRKLERILGRMRTEQEAERRELIQIGKLVVAESNENVPRYHLRERKCASPQPYQDISKRPSFSRDSRSNETQPPPKRQRKA